jgi:hypothetical protein
MANMFNWTWRSPADSPYSPDPVSVDTAAQFLACAAKFEMTRFLVKAFPADVEVKKLWEGYLSDQAAEKLEALGRLDAADLLAEQANRNNDREGYRRAMRQRKQAEEELRALGWPQFVRETADRITQELTPVLQGSKHAGALLAAAREVSLTQLREEMLPGEPATERATKSWADAGGPEYVRVLMSLLGAELALVKSNAAGHTQAAALAAAEVGRLEKRLGPLMFAKTISQKSDTWRQKVASGAPAGRGFDNLKILVTE